MDKSTQQDAHIRMALRGAGVLQIARMLAWAVVLFVTRSPRLAAGVLAACAYIAHPLDSGERVDMFADDADRTSDLREVMG